MIRATKKLFTLSALCLAANFVFAALAPNAVAHPASLPSVQAKVDRSGRLEIQVHFDLVAFALGQAHPHVGDHATDHFLGAPDDVINDVLADARIRFTDTLRVVCGETEASIDTIIFPTIQDVREIQESLATRHPSFMVDATILGSVPESAEQIAFGFSPSLNQLVLTVDRPGEAFHVEAIEPGNMSSTLALDLQAPWPSKLANNVPMDYPAMPAANPSSGETAPNGYSLTGVLTSSTGIASVIICAAIVVVFAWVFTRLVPQRGST